MRKPRPPETHFRTHLGRLSVSLTEGFVWVNGSDGWGSRSLTPAQCRRLAAWLLRAAEWMDSRNLATREERKS